MLLWIACATLGALTLGATALYNRLVGLRDEVAAAGRQIEVQRQRRRELVPRLLGVLPAGRARDLLERADRSGGELGRALAALEGAPARLGVELAECERRLASARRIHDAGVEAYDRAIERMPAAAIARATGLGRLGGRHPT